MARSTLLGVSLKSYFTHQRTLGWMRDVAALLEENAGVRDGRVEFFVAPTFVGLKDALRILDPHPVAAQDVSATGLGAYTGEVPAEELAEIGVSLVEIGHAERRRYFGETDDDFRAKCSRVMEHGMWPLLCVGEPEHQNPASTAQVVVQQARHALLGDEVSTVETPVVLAYEPYWAIGAPEPAPADYVQDVCRIVREELEPSFGNLSILYGGSAGPGTLTSLGDAVDGLFLGRFAHDPENVRRILEEAAQR